MKDYDADLEKRYHPENFEPDYEEDDSPILHMTYTRISQTLYKFFIEGKEASEYGEFYITINKDGTAELFGKDNDYQEFITKAIHDALRVK